ncbi:MULTISPECIES: hypothetical protein [unclassified Nostoc]|uniref:hypothetical protein n=1 Tax=unclassified Nostoc TaxID=2593658 RepID=UPI000B9537BF|nr:hypothetical protein [Nostoc sp. 'Peltigera membranacea cyanobiont' 232]OYE04630.1 hypothetical protein CDG79_12090 [Nostoc sp. 'Peltigera membranacea cyanobiont' 232]
MSETNAEYQVRLDEMIKTGKLKAEYKDILLEIGELGSKACALGLISGLGWGEDANYIVLNAYEILDKDGNFLYFTLSEARDYLHNLIADS